MTKQEKKAAKTLETKELHEWMYSLWMKMPPKKKCLSCGAPIWGEFKPLYFDHALEKSRYPQYRLVKENIVFVCSNCHWQKTNGYPSEKYKQIIQDIMNKHLSGELGKK